MKHDQPEPATTPSSAHTRAVDYIAAIAEGSPEQDSLLWFENATDETRLAAFVQLDKEVERLRSFIQGIAKAPQEMVCRLTSDAAKEVLANG